MPKVGTQQFADFSADDQTMVMLEGKGTCLTTVLSRKCIAATPFKQTSLLKRHLKISGQSCPLKFKRLAKMRQTPSLLANCDEVIVLN